jgi:pimeloyl-ACP methyl ester carboxylesterase
MLAGLKTGVVLAVALMAGLLLTSPAGPSAARPQRAAVAFTFDPRAGWGRPRHRRHRHRGPHGAGIVELPVAFSVVNVNRSKVLCPTDGRRYTIHGHLVTPAATLRRADRAVTLYLHGSTGGEWMFGEPHGTQFDTATQLARRGHASVVIDMLGYGASGDLAGGMVCFGGLADIAHQIVQRLRSGEYTLGPGRGVAFKRVALLGYSVGGGWAEIEAYSFGGIDALALLGWNDQPTGTVQEKLGPRVAVLCAAGGETKQGDGVGPSGYVDSWSTPQTQAADVFFDPDPSAAKALLPLINRDPCGLLESVPAAYLLDHLYARAITLPVLLMEGDHDMLMGSPSGGFALQRYVLAGSREVTMRVIPRAGHHLMAEKTAPIFQAQLSDWLTAHGF